MTTAPAIVRFEELEDGPAIRAVHEAAFPSPDEARLVDALRANGKAWVSLVAEADAHVVGHILFSPVTLTGHPLVGVGLAPVAVVPGLQKRGVGKLLVWKGIEVCRQRKYPFVVVLGEPAYYQQFGFLRATLRQLQNEYGVDEEFMVLQLSENVLPASGGLVKYAPEFAALGDQRPQDERV